MPVYLYTRNNRALAHTDQRRAQEEFLSVLNSQWASGLIPTARFPVGYDAAWVRGTTLPGPAIWHGTGRNGDNTTSLAALPLHAEVALQIYALSLRDYESRLWLQRVFPSLYRWHAHLHTVRCHADTGLVFIAHPWESSLPLTAQAWSSTLSDAATAAAAAKWKPPVVPPAVKARPDYPGDEQYSTELFLIQFLSDLGSNEHESSTSSGSAGNSGSSSSSDNKGGFRVIDAQFNAALMRSDQALLGMAQVLDATRSSW
jgi:hypothetical protein